MTESTASRTVSASTVLAMAVSFGVLAGLGELAVFGYDKLIAGKLVFTSRDVFWMAPLANVLYALVLGLVVIVATGGKPQAKVPLFVFGALVGAAIGYMFPTLSWVVVVVIALGLGVNLAKGGPATAARMAGLAAPLGVLLVLLFAGTWAWPMFTRSGPSTQAASGAPNVLFVTLDTVRSKSLSLYGHSRPTTPQLEQLAERAVVFDRAIAAAPWTLPSHSSMFTGRYPFEMSASWTTALDDQHPILSEALREAGYTTAGFVSNLNYTCYEVGLSRGYAHYDDYPVSLGQMILCSSLGRALTNSHAFREMLDWHENLNRRTAEDIRTAFTSWLDGQGDAPFYAFLNFYDAHQPYLPPEGFAGRWSKGVPRVGFRYDTNLIEIEEWEPLSPEQIEMEHDSYDEAIAYLDDELGKLFVELEQRGLLANTIIVVTSDHGEQFGEHEGLYNHGNSLYMPSVHVPLLIYVPGMDRAGSRVTMPVSLRDLPATVMELAGLDGSRFPGASLASAWEDPGAFAERQEIILSECEVIEGRVRQGDCVSLVVGKYHYIRNGPGTEELYDLEKDLDEQYDLTRGASGRAAIKTFAEVVDQNWTAPGSGAAEEGK